MIEHLQTADAWRRAGAEVWWNGDFHRVADPLRHLLDGLLSLSNPIGSPVDKVRVGVYRLKTLLRSNEDVLTGPEMSTMQRLKVLDTAYPAWSLMHADTCAVLTVNTPP